MDRDGWFKAMTKLFNIFVAYHVNNKNIFFNEHESHFYDHSLIHMYHLNIKLSILKSGNSVNDQPNDNGSNSKLKFFYNEVKYVWMLRYGTPKLLTRHITPSWWKYGITLRCQLETSSGTYLNKQSYFPSVLPT